MTDIASDGVRPLLQIRDLVVTIPTHEGDVHALRGVDLDIPAGKILGLVGESGGGKSMIANATIGMLPGRAVATGRVEFDGVDVLEMTPEQLQQHRGHGIAACFQNPRSALEPFRTIGKQLADRVKAHRGLAGKAAEAVIAQLLNTVGLTDIPRIVASYPHELSGGMAQRAMIALALACDPKLLIADEPTTGLDVTLTHETLALFRTLADELGYAVLLISHDIAAAASICDECVVIQAGEVVERGEMRALLASPAQRYTRELVAAVPDIDRPLPLHSAPAAGPSVVEVDRLSVTYRSRFGKKGHRALEEVSLNVHGSETVGIVGESGSGKTTLVRVLMGLVPVGAGAARVGDIDLTRLTGKAQRELSRSIQMIFQDPMGALDPRRTVLDAVAEPLGPGMSAEERHDRALAALEAARLDESYLQRRPHQLSGGQAQRVGIARALVADPSVLVFDEPTSALDVTVQAQILDLVKELAVSGNRAQVFISHDLATVRAFCDRVVVLYHGRIVEEGSSEQVFGDPQHAYTKKLLSAAPRLGARPAT